MKKAIECLTEFLDSELEGIGLEYNYEIDEDYYLSSEKEDRIIIFEISIFQEKIKNKYKRIWMKYKEDTLYVNIANSDEIWKCVEKYDWTVKYFWMAFLDWPL